MLRLVTHESCLIWKMTGMISCSGGLLRFVWAALQASWLSIALLLWYSSWNDFRSWEFMNQILPLFSSKSSYWIEIIGVCSLISSCMKAFSSKFVLISCNEFRNLVIIQFCSKYLFSLFLNLESASALLVSQSHI
jgi:hypothetical protein